MKTKAILLIFLCVAFSDFCQDSEKTRKKRDRLTKLDYIKVEPTQLVNLEVGTHYEHNFKGMFSAGVSAGVNKAGFMDISPFGKPYFEDYTNTSHDNRWGYHFGGFLRLYLKPHVGPTGFFIEGEMRYKTWYKEEIDLGNSYGHAKVRLALEDLQLIPKVGWVPNRKHWFEMYVGLSVNQTSGTIKGSKWVGSGNGTNGSAFVSVDENVQRVSFRPKLGFSFCF